VLTPNRMADARANGTPGHLPSLDRELISAGYVQASEFTSFAAIDGAGLPMARDCRECAEMGHQDRCKALAIIGGGTSIPQTIPVGQTRRVAAIRPVAQQ